MVERDRLPALVPDPALADGLEVLDRLARVRVVVVQRVRHGHAVQRYLLDAVYVAR